MSEPFNNRTRVWGNGEIYRVKKVHKLLKKFERMTWIEQQSFLMAIKDKIKPPPNDHWAVKFSLRQTKNKELT
jgi:hypothetical protein